MNDKDVMKYFKEQQERLKNDVDDVDKLFQKLELSLLSVTPFARGNQVALKLVQSLHQFKALWRDCKSIILEKEGIKEA